MATIVEVARQAGVTASVVSRLLNGDPTLRIRAETRDRVLAVAAALDYTPNHAARALRRARAGTLGLAVHDLHNPVYAEIIAGAEAEARERGSVLLVADVNSLASDDETFRRVVQGGAIDGLMLQRDGDASDKVVARVAGSRVPVVILNERVRSPLSGVAVDDRRAAMLATRHLIALGHRDIAYLQVSGSNSRARDRRAGWQAAMRDAGLDATGRMVVGGVRPETGYRAMTDLLAAHTPPTAVFAGTLLAGVGALTAARDAGVSVPARLSVIGFHDGWFAEHVYPALTVVRLPLRELGRQAVRLLARRIDGAEAEQILVSSPEPELVPRGSTGPAPARRG
ncbi:LacI family DNA-binding transcriptional regulator [Rugosimonospora africana]|uniref:LacI family transcriptional regulator n=1 Tax=Rugosimonospora africana TaxID=556532 RepID=A0A8J3QNP4_9ACTN|nr:LacI family DNA-binding transcriptional regulator [Rugosimonospora africana]GIH14264.1 LacI family transcriptional regulator [Rugosimonospora africana]